MNHKFENQLQAYRNHIESSLDQRFAQLDILPQKKLFEAMKYSLLAGGKRLRPILAFEFCNMCCADWKRATPFAAAIEMIHTYSLIHDDLPSMDNDDYRRGRLTNHKVYGEAMAILAGDALLTDAFSVAASAELDGAILAAGISTLAECAGSLGMVGGQVLDMQSQQRELSRQEVLDIQSRKTGAMIRAACRCGALAGGATQEQLKASEIFAENLGLAFQIRDDMLDVIGNVSDLGKAIGVDQDKNTFVRLYGIDQCQHLVESYTQNAINALEPFDNKELIIWLAAQLTDRIS